MKTRLLHDAIIVIAVSFALLSGSKALAQGRAVGQSRDGGKAVDSAPRTPQQSAETADRPIRAQKPIETPAPPAPNPGTGRPGRPQPVSQAPAIADPVPQPARVPHQAPRVPHHVPDNPVPDHRGTIIVVEEGPTINIVSEPEGLWLREGVRFGRDVTLATVESLPEYSGYDFSEVLKRPFDHPYTDMWAEEDDGFVVMDVAEDSEIVDIGRIAVPPDVIYIPHEDWSANRMVVLVEGHEYVVRTWDNNYAKFFVTEVRRDRVSFDWAYQWSDDNGRVLAVRPLIRFAR